MPRHSSNFSCGIFVQIIDWYKHFGFTATVFISDLGSDYDESILDAFTP